jgi:hypothetical protein
VPQTARQHLQGIGRAGPPVAVHGAALCSRHAAGRSPPARARRTAVVINPTKHDDVAELKDAVRAAMAEHDWGEPLWFETTPAEPGTGHAAQAVRSGVDLGCGFRTGRGG